MRQVIWRPARSQRSPMPLINNLASRLYTSGTQAYKDLSVPKDGRQLQLEIDDLKPCYTSGDKIRGRAILNFDKATTVTAIKVKLKCDIESRVCYHEFDRNEYSEARSIRPASMRQGRENRLSTSRDQVYRKEVQVFPTADLAHTGSKSYTISAGQHAYEFELEFPHHPDNSKCYPPTLAQVEGETYFKCVHSVKITVQKQSSFSFNQRAEKEVRVVPPFDPARFEATKLAPISERAMLDDTIEVDAQVILPENGLPQAPRSLPAQLAIKASEPVVVKNVYVSLEQTTRWYSRNPKRRLFGVEDKKTIILGKFPVNRAGQVVDLTDMMQNLCISDYAAPSFKEPLLEVSYEVVVGISVSKTAGVLDAETVEIRGPVKVLPPSLAEDLMSPAPQVDLPPSFDEKGAAETINDLKSGQNARPYLPAYQT